MAGIEDFIPGLGAVGNIAGSLIGNIGAKNRQKQANEDNIEFWNMQNQYNHPSAQMARLREGGLNPNLIYGTPSGAATGNAEKIAPSKAAPYNADGLKQAGATYVALKNTRAQTNNLELQGNVIQQELQNKIAEEKSTRANTVAQNIQNMLNAGAFPHDMQARGLQASEKQAAIENTQANTNQTNTLTPLKAAQLESTTKKAIAEKDWTAVKMGLDQARLTLRLKGIEVTDDKIWRILGLNSKEIQKIMDNSGLLNFEHSKGN